MSSGPPLGPTPNGSAGPTTTRATLDRSLAKGIAWVGGVKWGAQILGWVSTIFVARLLTPVDYGLVGLAAAYLGLVSLLSEFGVGSTIVAMREIGDDQLAQLNTVALLFGAVGFAVSCAIAPLLAWYFEAPQLTLVVMAMALVFVISAVKVAPMAVLQKELRFKEVAVNESIQALVSAGSAVAFAVAGYGYWALVMSAVLSAVLSTVGALRLVTIPFARPDWRRLRHATKFSRDTLWARLSWYWYQNADFFIASKLLGTEIMGAYRFAWDLASSPIEKTTSLVGRVTPAVLSAAQHDLAELRRYVVRVTHGLSLVAVPMTIGLALVADSLVPAVLGAKWSAMIVPTRLLAIGAAMRSVSPLLPQVMSVTGLNHRVASVNMFAGVLMPIAFWLGAKYGGAAGIAWAWILVFPFCAWLPMAWFALRRIQLPAREYVGALWPAASSAMVMAAGVMTLKVFVATPLRPMQQLVIEIAVGAVCYLSALLVLHRQSVGLITRTLRFVRS